jgi:hypothetical protein
VDADEVSSEGFWPDFAPDSIACLAVALAFSVGVSFHRHEVLSIVLKHDADMRKVKGHDIARLGGVLVGVNARGARAIFCPLEESIRQRGAGLPLGWRAGEA